MLGLLRALRARRTEEPRNGNGASRVMWGARVSCNPEYGPDGKAIAATDWLGNRFAVGEVVMYCVGAGRGQLMALGRVIKIIATTRDVHRYRLAEEGETPDRESYGNRQMRVTTQRTDVSVQVLTERTSGEWGNGARSRPAMVNPLNITALSTLSYSALDPK